MSIQLFCIAICLLSAPGKDGCTTCLVILEMGSSGRQLAGQRARLAAEPGVVLVRTESCLYNQLAVGEEWIVRTVWM